MKKKKITMQLLAPLTEWKSNVIENGIGKGGIVTTRYVFMANHWNWFIGLQRGNEDSPVSGENYYPSMRLALPAIITSAELRGIEPLNAIAGVIAALEQKCGKFPSDIINVSTDVDEMANLGRQMDLRWNLIFGFNHKEPEYPPSVLKRVFGVEDAE